MSTLEEDPDIKTTKLIHKIEKAHSLLQEFFAVKGEASCRKSRNRKIKEEGLEYLSKKLYKEIKDNLSEEQKKELEMLFDNACNKYLFGQTFSTDVKTKNPKLDLPLYNKIDLPTNQKLYAFYSLLKLPTKEIMSLFEIKNKNAIDDDVISPNKQSELAQTKEKLLDSINEFEPLDIDNINTDLLNEFVIIDNKPDSMCIRKNIVDAVDNYELNREKITSVSDIPIYFVIVVGAQRGIHASIVVLYDSNIYTIGFGYSGYVEKKGLNKMQKTVLKEFLPKKASLYSPDYLINEALDNNIVDIGILNSKHVRQLNNYISKSKTLISKLKTSVIKDEHGRLKEILYFHDEKNNEVSFDKHFLTDIDDAFYSQISSEKVYDQALNCATFVTKIFPNVTCSRFKTYSDPKFCRTEPQMNESKISEIINRYLDGNIEAFEDILKHPKCEGEKCAIMGGKKKKRTHFKRKSRRLRKTTKRRK
jgi:hypothetical protein